MKGPTITINKSCIFEINPTEDPRVVKVTVSDAGGVGTTIAFIAKATDRSGNKATEIIEIDVLQPGGTQQVRPPRAWQPVLR